jgi:hypothetical protein
MWRANFTDVQTGMDKKYIFNNNNNNNNNNNILRLLNE